MSEYLHDKSNDEGVLLPPRPRRRFVQSCQPPNAVDQIPVSLHEAPLGEAIAGVCAPGQQGWRGWAGNRW